MSIRGFLEHTTDVLPFLLLPLINQPNLADSNITIKYLMAQSLAFLLHANMHASCLAVQLIKKLVTSLIIVLSYDYIGVLNCIAYHK